MWFLKNAGSLKRMGCRLESTTQAGAVGSAATRLNILHILILYPAAKFTCTVSPSKGVKYASFF